MSRPTLSVPRTWLKFPPRETISSTCWPTETVIRLLSLTDSTPTMRILPRSTKDCASFRAMSYCEPPPGGVSATTVFSLRIRSPGDTLSPPLSMRALPAFTSSWASATVIWGVRSERSISVSARSDRALSPTQKGGKRRDSLRSPFFGGWGAISGANMAGMIITTSTITRGITGKRRSSAQTPNSLRKGDGVTAAA